MKKLFITMVVHLAIVLSATKAIAQEPSIAHAGTPAAGPSAPAFANYSTGSSGHSNAVSDRVSKKFEKSFANVTDAVWAKEANGFTVRFTSNGIQNWALFTKRGNYQGGIRYYTETELPAAIRHQVKSTYYDFAITTVKEVSYSGTTAYLVTIADETTWKVIRVIDGAMEVWEAYKKA